MRAWVEISQMYSVFFIFYYLFFQFCFSCILRFTERGYTISFSLDGKIIFEWRSTLNTQHSSFLTRTVADWFFCDAACNFDVSSLNDRKLSKLELPGIGFKQTKLEVSQIISVCVLEDRRDTVFWNPNLCQFFPKSPHEKHLNEIYLIPQGNWAITIWRNHWI